MIEIDERAAWPKLLLKILSGDDLAGLPGEVRQDLQRLSFELCTERLGGLLKYYCRAARVF
jgi:hypothetical protein